jgi:hypothetical protein
MEAYQMEGRAYRSASLALSISFAGLDPYEVENLCEMLFVEYERLVTERRDPRLNFAEFQHVHILGMRKFHLKQMYMQKVDYESSRKAKRLLAQFTTELTDKEKAQHKKQHRKFFDELEREKKDPAHRSGQGLKVSGDKKKAAA